MPPDERLTPTPGMVGRDERSEGERKAGMTLEDLAAKVGEGFEHVLRREADNHRAIEGVRRTVEDVARDLGERIEIIEEHVFPGGKPPPRRARMRSISEVADSNAGELAELAGYVASVDSRLVAVESINKQQSRAMGLAMPDASGWRKLRTFVLSRKGAEFIVAIATLVAAVSGSARALEALSKVERAIAPAGQVAP